MYSNHMRVYQPDEPGYARLVQAAQRLQERSGLECKVQTVYYDFGQAWLWTTILARRATDTNWCQILSPRDHQDIIEGDDVAFDRCLQRVLETDYLFKRKA